jgi:quinol---cytochrome c reductase iron-sulfur subunit, bacillus type
VQPPGHESSSPDRRTVLKRAIYGMASLFGALLGIPAIAFLLDPRNRPVRDNEFETVARLGDLPIGEPQQVVIRAMRRDAWTLHPDEVIGRVWLVRHEADAVDAFTTICPHLGCSVNFDSKDKLFICPCHGGTFDAHGERVEKPGVANPAPRGMDRLACQRDPANPELIQVKYQDFIQGKETAIPKT